MKQRRNPRKKPAIPARKQLARPSTSPPASPQMRPDQIGATRELFWQNVMREMLTSLSTLSMQGASPESREPESAAEAPSSKAEPAEQSAEPAAGPASPSLFDGRLAVVTRAGERIPIADVVPLFACGLSAPGLRNLNAAVECTVFQIRTPDGHVFTLPIHEIRGFHAMSPELMERLEQSAARRAARRNQSEEPQPFGFAAFTALARGVPSQPLEPPPSSPME